jgi:2-hydroxy-6-oxonona-2,4-dienedioate hydrolase
MARGFEVLAGWSSIDRLHQVKAPTLLLWGREDVFTSLPQAHRIATRIPDSTLEVFGECGHFPWLEHPEEFFATIRTWLTKRGLLE